MKTGTIINLIFDANRGSVSTLSREGVVGEPFGKLPTPTRRGYTFGGWYNGDAPVTPETVIEADGDVRLVAHWEKAVHTTDKKRSMLKRQKIAIVALAAVALVLIVTFVIVSQLIAIYSFVDTYTVDGVEYNDKYYVKRHEGVYKLFDKDGNLMDTNGVLDTVFVARGSGNEYKIDPETGKHTLRATVDAEDGEYSSGTVLLMFPQVRSEYLYSIEMKNEQGGDYTIYRTADGIKVKDFEKTSLEFDQDLFAQLCFSCGYMLSNRKMSEHSTDPLIPRTEDGSIDYSVYGLDTPQATYTISGMLFKKNADGSDMYKNGKYVIDYDEDGNPKPDPEKTYTVHIGDAILSGGGYYVRLEGRGSVYIVTTDYIKTTVLQPIENLVVPRVVFPVSVTYHSMGKDFLLGKLDDWTKDTKVELETIVAFTYSELEERVNTTNSTRPYLPGISVMSGYNINENSAISVFETFYSIEAIACRRIGLNAETMAEFGLDKNVYYLTYKTFSGNYDAETGDKLYVDNELFISQKTEDGTYYVAAVPFDMIVEVDQYYLSFLEWDDMKWYNEAFIFHNIAYVRDIKFEFNGKAFNLPEDKVYDFDLDNSLSYAYYMNEKGEFKAVNLKEGKVYIEGGKKVYLRKGVSYDIITEVNLDTVRVVSYKDIILDPTLSGVVYVPENYYYVKDGENVNVSPDYVTKVIEYDVERDENGKYVGGRYYYVNLTTGERIRVNRSFGDPVYCYEHNGKIYEATLGITASGLLVSCNGNLLDYNISNSGMGDSGVTEYETVTATDNFRKLHMQLLYFSLVGDVDPVEFQEKMGMSVEEYLASEAKKPIATISTHVEDYARALNGYTYYNENGEEVRYYDENTSQYFVYNFYQYSDWKVLVTVELFTKNENGEFVTNSPDGVVGKFYASTAILEKLVGDIDRLLNEELIDYETKY